jgi:hypothetical protein
MPAKKLNSTETKSTKKVDKEFNLTQEIMETETIEITKVNDVNESIKTTDVTDDNDSNKKMVRKAGRTLLVSSSNNMSKSETIFSKLTGLSANHSTENGSFFLTFNTVQNALDSFYYLRQNHPEIRVKFARYQIFFTISGLTNSSDYSIIKQNITNFVEKEADANVLYFKLYRKGDKYLGCGDFTIDTKDAMDKLLKKEGSLKNYTIGDLSGTFYRYNKTKQNQNNEDFEHN